MSKLQHFFQREPFLVPFMGSAVHGDILRPAQAIDTAPALLMLHGNQPRHSRADFTALRQYLLTHYGLASCAIDLLGHGASDANFAPPNSISNVAQCANVIDACFDCQPLSMIVTGNHFYTALELLADYPIENLIFLPNNLHLLNATNTDSPALLPPLTPAQKTNFTDILQAFGGKLWLITNTATACVSSDFCQQLQLNTEQKRFASVFDMPSFAHFLRTILTPRSTALKHKGYLVGVHYK